MDVIGFGAGEPDFNTPDYIKEAGIAGHRAQRDPLHSLRRHGGAAQGRLPAAEGRLRRGVYSPARSSVSNGAKPCVYVALRALVNPGDEVILPAPYWVSYYELIKMVGGVPVVVDTPRRRSTSSSPPEKLRGRHHPQDQGA